MPRVQLPLRAWGNGYASSLATRSPGDHRVLSSGVRAATTSKGSETASAASDIGTTRTHKAGGVTEAFSRHMTPGITHGVTQIRSASSLNASASARASDASSRLLELAAIITREAEKLDDFLRESGTSSPGNEVDSPADFPKLPSALKSARSAAIKATKELNILLNGPTDTVRWMSWDHNDALSLRAIYAFGIAKSFPIGETASFAQIAEKVDLSEANVRRFIYHAMTNGIFKEVSPGVIAHTAMSRVLVENVAMSDWVGFTLEDIWPATTKTVDALKAYPAANEPVQAGFQLANNTVNVEPMFVTLGKSGFHAKRFGGAMASLTTGEGYDSFYLVDNFDWASIDARGGTVVDLGGSHGFICVDLAKRFPNLNFVVQDLPKTIASAPAFPEDEHNLNSRINFLAHDFHTQQPVVGADVYLFRWIMHNHSDKYAINMLRQLIPALKPGARVLINDYCLPESSLAASQADSSKFMDDRVLRTMDLVMLSLLNAQERTPAQFEELFKQADERFKWRGVVRPEGCRMSIIEVEWEG